jgi:hypothetical protein
MFAEFHHNSRTDGFVDQEGERRFDNQKNFWTW